jgi:3-oxoacyl-[acyl-carrier protein] reductase
MNDVLLKLGENRQARKLIKSIGLPLPLPVALDRATGPWEAEPLRGRAVVLGGGGARPALTEGVTAALRAAGAEVKTTTLDAKVHGLIFDATGLASPPELRALYDFFQPLVAKLAASGRVLVLGRPPAACDSAASAAVQSALEGFTRSLAKEVGKKGATAELLRVGFGAELAIAPALRFLLSPRSAFISAQVLAVEATADNPAAWPLVRPLASKVALVTGAARGIGQATAQLLAGEGAHVICLDRPEDGQAAQQLAKQIGGSALLFDLSDGRSPGALAQAIRDKHGGLDVLVHNAGITRDKTLQRMSGAQWDQALDVNLAAVLRVDEALGGLLKDGGREICLTSVAGIAGNVGQTNYAAAKAGLIGYVKRRSAELSGRRITVNAVAPGFIETRLTSAMPVFVREAGRRLSALGQGGQPRDVAEAIAFLASPGAAGITGSVLRVCGGGFIGA